MNDLARAPSLLPPLPDGEPPAPVERPSLGRARTLGVRLSALSVLGLVATGVAWVADAAWQATRDAFIAPLTLSPDSAAVLESKLRLADLELERTRSVAQADAASADADDADEELSRLHELEDTLAQSAPWGQAVHGAEASASAAELNNLAQRQGLLAKMIDKQQKLAAVALKNLRAGVISQTEYEQEKLRLDQLQLSAMETARARAQSELTAKKATLGVQALAGKAPAMPEMVAREDLAARVGVERLRLEARKRAKLAEKDALLARVRKLDALQGQLQRNPLFRVGDAPLELAFVPYTQLAGVEAGASVRRCTLVVFACEVVGTVAELIPGEVVQQDPWGKSERGQYVVLALTDRTAARAKTLRVRPGGGIGGAFEWR